MSTILNVAAATQIPASLTAQAQPKPLPNEVEQGLATIQFWIQGIGGSIAVIGLMVLFIGLFFANRHGQGQDFLAKAGWWLAGAIGLGTAAVIAPVFL